VNKLLNRQELDTSEKLRVKSVEGSLSEIDILGVRVQGQETETKLG
jgi:hypothetical protein